MVLGEQEISSHEAIITKSDSVSSPLAREDHFRLVYFVAVIRDVRFSGGGYPRDG